METTTKEKAFFRRREPLQTMLLIALTSIGITFFILLFIYFVKTGGFGGRLPLLFWFSTLAIGLSSFTLYQAQKCIKTDKFDWYRVYIWATLVFGLLFLLFQVLAWQTMWGRGTRLDNSLSGAFVYVISGLHFLHVLVGIILLVKTVIQAQIYRDYVDAYIFHINPPNQLKIKLLSIYWHFVGVLWLVLFLILLV